MKGRWHEKLWSGKTTDSTTPFHVSDNLVNSEVDSLWIAAQNKNEIFNKVSELEDKTRKMDGSGNREDVYTLHYRMKTVVLFTKE